MMQEQVKASATDSNINSIGGNQRSWQALWNAYTFMRNCICLYCGKQFSDNRHIRHHYTKCAYNKFTGSGFIRHELLKCTKCGKKLLSTDELMLHEQRCGSYVSMSNRDDRFVVNDNTKSVLDNEMDCKDTAENVIIIMDEDEDEDESCKSNAIETDLDPETNTQEDNTEEVTDNNTHKIDKFEMSHTSTANKSITHNSSDLNHSDKTEIDYSFQTSEHMGEDVRIENAFMEGQIGQNRKRKYDFSNSTCSTITLYDKSKIESKKMMSKDDETEFSKCTEGDVQQEHMPFRLIRTQKEQKSHKCPKCDARFKYKHTFDIHVKFAHAQLGLLTSTCDLKKTQEQSEDDRGVTEFNKSHGPTDEKHVSTSFDDVTMKANDYSGFAPKVGNYPCDFCPMSFRHNSRCERHIKNCHKEQLDELKFGNLFRCTTCNERFPEKYALLKHCKRYHMRNINKWTSSLEQTINEQFINILKAKNATNHLRNNLTCLQDGMDTKTDQSSDEPHLKINSHLRERELNIFNQSGGIRESLDSNTSAFNDINTAANLEKTARGTDIHSAFNIFHNYGNAFTMHSLETKAKSSDSVCSQKAEIKNYLPTNNGIDTPLDLSVNGKAETQSKAHSPSLTSDKIVPVNDIPLNNERNLLLDYYKVNLPEYCLK